MPLRCRNTGESRDDSRLCRLDSPRHIQSGAASSPPWPQRFRADAQRTRTAAVNSHTCQWEKIPREMKKSPVQCRSAAMRQKARVKASSAAGIRRAAQASAKVWWRAASFRFVFLRIRTRTGQPRSSYEATRRAAYARRDCPVEEIWVRLTACELACAWNIILREYGLQISDRLPVAHLRTWPRWGWGWARLPRSRRRAARECHTQGPQYTGRRLEQGRPDSFC